MRKKNVRNSIIKILFFEKEKIKKINMILKGYRHFHKKITGKFPFLICFSINNNKL